MKCTKISWLFSKTAQILGNVSVSDSNYSEQINYIIAIKKFRFCYRDFCVLLMYSVFFSVASVHIKASEGDSIFAFDNAFFKGWWGGGGGWVHIIHFWKRCWVLMYAFLKDFMKWSWRYVWIYFVICMYILR